MLLGGGGGSVTDLYIMGGTYVLREQSLTVTDAALRIYAKRPEWNKISRL